MSSKREKPPPRVVYRFGRQDRNTKDFVKIRKTVKKIEKNCWKVMAEYGELGLERRPEYCQRTTKLWIYDIIGCCWLRNVPNKNKDKLSNVCNDDSHVRRGNWCNNHHLQQRHRMDTEEEDSLRIFQRRNIWKVKIDLEDSSITFKPVWPVGYFFLWKHSMQIATIFTLWMGWRMTRPFANTVT